MTSSSQPWKMYLPLERGALNQMIHCPLEPCEENDRDFDDWETPLTWKWVASKVKLDEMFHKKRAVHFCFEKRTPAEVWKTNWSLWYDAAFITREEVPSDVTIQGTFGFEEVTCGYGSDNNVHVRPWVGIVGRMLDLRRYYFLCYEYPDAVVLYKREDNQWHKLASRSFSIDIFTPISLGIHFRGARIECFAEGRELFSVVDYAYDRGKCGIRANCTSFCTELTITSTEKEVGAFSILKSKEQKALLEARNQLPQPFVEKRISIPASQPVQTMLVEQFEEMKEYPSLFYSYQTEEEGYSHAMMDCDGSILWRANLRGLCNYIATSRREDGRLDIFGYSRDEIMLINGRSGEVIRSRRIDTLPHAPKSLKEIPSSPANLMGTSHAQEFILTTHANGRQVWALDAELNDLWYAEPPSGTGHGHHVSMFDVDGDGKEEIFAGGAMYDQDGKEIWRNRELLRGLTVPNAGHVDATQIGFFDGDDEAPLIHMQGSSAGHFIVNARTGETIIDHPQGHAQGGAAARLVPEMNGLQVVSNNRWGNYGISAIYAGNGPRISRFQPDFWTDIPGTVNWDGSGIELILYGKDPRKTGLYDYLGRMLVDLRQHLPSPYSTGTANKERNMDCLPVGKDGRDRIFFRVCNKLHVIAPSGDAPKGKVYRPIRRNKVSYPNWVHCS